MARLRRVKHDSEPRRGRTQSTLELRVLKGTVLGVKVFRGFARLCDLSLMSKADIFDQKNNPTGTQRDLSPKHARNAYNYVKNNHDLAFWPEVFLCARKMNHIKFDDSGNGVGILKIDLKAIRSDIDIHISRVDGNHRLHYADGETSGFPPLLTEVSFCLSYDLTLEQEIKLFRDINDNQKRMNTSHLDNISARLTPEEIRKRQDPELYMAKKLGEDPDSPFFEMIYEGGKKPGYFTIPLRTLKSGIRYMLSQQSKLSALPDIDAQYTVIANYFRAVKIWQPKAWQEPTKYLVLRGAGLWGICFIGADVINRALTEGKYSPPDMVKVLRSGADWDWSKNGDFQGFSGRGGASRIRDIVVAEFADESGISIRNLAKEILAKKRN